MADPVVMKEMRSVDGLPLSSLTDVPVDPVDSRLESGLTTTTHTSLHDPITDDGFKLSKVPHSPIDPRLEPASTFHRDSKTKEDSDGPIYVGFSAVRARIGLLDCIPSNSIYRSSLRRTTIEIP